ncbi:hypothetical protein HK102_003679 [Quaeritorhiza haematococci]|nr:hypothetical protein HK102_003679 [Quaeritorhiza haematococci]
MPAPRRRGAGGGASATTSRGRAAPAHATPITPKTNARRHDLALTPASAARSAGIARPTGEDELRKSFEECVKMATGNKINATNSWGLPLIDYFAEMRLLRDGDSINFQKASCTLDGCVKIYASRIDSLDDETKKLHSTLVDDLANSSKKAKNKRGNEGEEGEEGEGKTSKKRGGSNSTLAPDTKSLDLTSLADHVEHSFFNIDPLFHKTCADFDEGGARGLLLNTLAITMDGRVVFDSADVSTNSSDAQLHSGDFGGDEIPLARFPDEILLSLRDLNSKDVCPSLKTFEFNTSTTPSTASFPAFDPQKFVDDAHQVYDQWMADAGDDDDDDDFFGVDSGGVGGVGGVEGMVGVGSADHFHMIPFGDDTSNDVAIPIILNEMRTPGRVLRRQTNSSFAVDDEEGGGGPDEGLDFMMGNEDVDEAAAMMKMMGLGGDVGGDNGEAGANLDAGDDKTGFVFSYFDRGMMNNWAGPELWRSRRLRNRDPKTVAAEDPAEKPKRKSRTQADPIDFTSRDKDIPLEVLFAKGATSINLPKKRKSKGSTGQAAGGRGKKRKTPAEDSDLEDEDDEEMQREAKANLLPEDTRFTVDDFFRFFLKPHWKNSYVILIYLRTKAADETTLPNGVNDELLVDGNPALPHVALGGENGETDFMGGDDLEPLGFDDDDDDDDDMFDDGGMMPDDMAIPGGEGFNLMGEAGGVGHMETLTGEPQNGIGGVDGVGLQGTSGGEFGNGSGISSGMLNYGDQLVALPRKAVRAKALTTYARVAKKVDVRKLKECLWREVQTGWDGSILSTPPSPEDANNVEAAKEAEKDEDESDQELRFTQVIQGLRKFYPPKKLVDISVPFCFICLLHLANENGLELQRVDLAARGDGGDAESEGKGEQRLVDDLIIRKESL